MTCNGQYTITYSSTSTVPFSPSSLPNLFQSSLFSIFSLSTVSFPFLSSHIVFHLFVPLSFLSVSLLSFSPCTIFLSLYSLISLHSLSIINSPSLFLFLSSPSTTLYFLSSFLSTHISSVPFLPPSSPPSLPPSLLPSLSYTGVTRSVGITHPAPIYMYNTDSWS